MGKRVMLLAVLWMMWETPAAAQSSAQLDSLIAHWIALGPSSHWQPFRLFEGCPNLTPEQERGIDKVLELQLEDHRRSGRTRALGLPLAGCGHQRLDRWFFDQMDEAIRDGTLLGDLDLQVAFRNANTAPVRQYLARVMTNRELPDYAREVAGYTLLDHLSPNERLDLHLAAFEAGTLPWGLATGGTRRLLREDGARLVAGMSEMVRRNPLLARETAFMQVVESSAPFLSDELRQSLGAALAQGLRARPDLDTPTREELLLLAEWLRQPRQGRALTVRLRAWCGRRCRRPHGVSPEGVTCNPRRYARYPVCYQRMLPARKAPLDADQATPYVNEWPDLDSYGPARS